MNSTALQLRRAATNRYLFAASLLALFHPCGQFQEQQRVLHIEPGVTATIVAPPRWQFDAARPTLLVLYALPNGNTTAQTIGRSAARLDWHYDIQHIGADPRAAPGHHGP